jgi:CelD/BcsL family acetyltransferase involved in cellulose biosynthesis
LVLLRIHEIFREVNRTLRLVLLREIPEDANLRQQWNQLVQRVERPQVFYTYEWSLAVQRAYHNALHPLLFLAYDEVESLCGVASLAADMEARRASFLCATTGDYCDFLSLPEHKGAFVAAVLGDLRKQGIADANLTNLPADSDTVAALKDACIRNGYHSFSRTAYVCTQVSLPKLERRIGDNTLVLPGKKMLRRSLSALGHLAPVRLDHARSWEEIERILPDFMQAHVARFLATGRISNIAYSERRMFLSELAKLLSKARWLVLTRMMSGEKVLAWNYGFQFRDTWFWYQPTFDSDLEKYSPGFCLLAKLIENAAESPELSIVDLGLGAEQYKERFANQTRETLCVTLRTSLVRHAREILHYRVAEGIKSDPRLEALTRRVISRCQQMRKSLDRDGIAGILRRLSTRANAILWARNEVFFFEWSGRGVHPDSGVAKLEPIDLNRLSSFAMQYLHAKSTPAYVLRSASRLRDGDAEGFALISEDGSIVRFGWVAVFDGFLIPELKAKLDTPAANCVMLFDSWPPIGTHSEASYRRMIGLIAERMREKGKKLWIFRAGIDLTSIQDLEKAGFQLRYSLVRRRALGWQTVRRAAPKLQGALVAQGSARI